MLLIRPFLPHLVAIFLLAFAGSQPAWADPPGRVGRLMMLEGPVKFYADQEEGWQAARLNLPVTGENSIWAEGRARAEWRTGPVAVRLDHDTVLDVQKLDDTSAVLYVQRGAVNIRIGLLEKSESWLIHTPEGHFTLRARGSYRIEADPDKRESRIAVLAGRARVESRSGSPWIDAGRMAILESGALRLEPLARTDFDDWAQARDEGLDPERVTHVSPHMTGYEDLDRHGSWEPAEEYGTVWVPARVDDDWAPYRYGSWRYVRPWGWTWIDDAPWGFAPFHYGRWVQVRGRWAWWPGNRIYRPVYSPALVAWVGGNGWSISIGSGRSPGVAWFPLAPWEAYVPWYSHSPTYVYNINHIHVGRPVPTRPPRDYRNFKPGVTVVPPATFENRHPVWRDRIRNPGESLWNQRPVQEVNALPPRPAPGSQGRPPLSKPATLPPASVGSPGTPAQSPAATPMPLPQRETLPRPSKPVAQEPRPVPGSLPPGAKPGTTVMPDSSTDSMPSRPAPSRAPGSAMQSSPAPSAGTQPAPAPSMQSQPAPVYNPPRGRVPGEAGQFDTRPQQDERIRDGSGNPAARTTRPERVERIDRNERNERIERPRQEIPVQKPGAIERTPLPDRAPVERVTPREKPAERQPDRPREPGKDRESAPSKPDRNDRGDKADKGDKGERSDKGERTQLR